MSVTFLSARLTDDSLVSNVDDAFRNFEAAFTSYFGIPIDEAVVELMQTDAVGFINWMRVMGLRIYDVDSIDIGDRYAWLDFEDNTDSPATPFLVFKETAIDGTGVVGVEIGRIRLTDKEAGTTPVYMWVEDSGEISFSAYEDMTLDRTVLINAVDGEGERQIVSTLVPTADDVGKSIVLGSDLLPEWGIPAAPYFVATPLGGAGSTGAYELSTTVVYPRMGINGSENISLVSIGGEAAVGVRFTEPGAYSINGMFQISNNQDLTAPAEAKAEPATGSSLASGDVISSGGGILHSGVGNCTFGATVRVSVADAAATATIWFKVTLDQTEGVSTYKQVGDYGFVNINRVSDYDA